MQIVCNGNVQVSGIAKEAGAIYKINQMVLVNTEILDSYLEQFKMEE